MKTKLLLSNPRWLFAIAVGLLALHPLIWLINTWINPAYQSNGFLVALLVAGLLVWSLAPSRSTPQHPTTTKFAFILLSLTALIRLISQILGVNVIGALALIVDVYALGLLLRLHLRQRAISPFWLAVLFGFALPLEHIMQHTIGYGLQLISAMGACQLLNLGAEPVHCEGVRILLAGKDVLVDLPCSGARGLLLLFILFSALATITRPNWLYAIFGIVITLMAAFIVNLIRIVLLAIGLAYADNFSSIDVMAQPYHDLIGLTALGIGIIPIVWWAMKVPKPISPHFPVSKETDFLISLPSIQPVRFIAISFLILAILIINLPIYPIDVARKIESPVLPNFISHFSAIHHNLSPSEQHYFTQYGGGAAKATYGPYGLLIVSTSAPLRHLHTPLECLSGAGHKVRYVTSIYRPLPTAIYHSIDPQGQQWYIRVTFLSDNGMTTPYVSEAVWQWLKNRNITWTMVQRIAPFDMPNKEIETWDIAISRALELPFTQYLF
jgi:exosortase/archaeosortase family protein